METNESTRDKRLEALNAFLEAGGTGPTPEELKENLPGVDIKELLRQREEQREASDYREGLRQGRDAGTGRWR